MVVGDFKRRLKELENLIQIRKGFLRFLKVELNFPTNLLPFYEPQTVISNNCKTNVAINSFAV